MNQRSEPRETETAGRQSGDGAQNAGAQSAAETPAAGSFIQPGTCPETAGGGKAGPWLDVALPGDTQRRQLRIDSGSPAPEAKPPAGPGPWEEPATMPPPPPREGPPEVDPAELMRLYSRKQHEQLAGVLLDVLGHFQDHQYTAITPQLQARVDAFVESLLYILTKPDFEISNKLAPALVGCNHIIANLVAISSFENTDPQLRIVMRQPRNFAKLLVLYSPRNTIWIDSRAFFDVDAPLASQWYAVYPLAVAGWSSPVAWENVRRHYATADPRLMVTGKRQAANLYFACSSVVPDSDRHLKARLNETIRDQVRGIPVENNPAPSSIAILTGKWFPASSVYRSSFPFLRALAEHYDLTLVHLGTANDEIETSLFREVRHVVVDEQEVKLDEVLRNDFQLAYYPDIGMSPESIWLSNMRLALIQAMGYGHPVSTFGSQIDYFLGGTDAELVEDARRNYSERLVLLPGIGAQPVYPNYQRRPRPRREETIWINCSWGTSKVNYPMLMNLKAIRQRAERPVRFRLFCGAALQRYNGLLPFLRNVGAALGKDAVLVEMRAYDSYMELMEQAELALDSYPFGGYNTIVDSLYLAKPVVTLEGTRFYNRAASALLRKVGLEELIAQSDEEYVEKASRLINDDGYRRGLSDALEKMDLQAKLIDADEPKYFRKAIDYLIRNQETLGHDESREPIFIR